MAELVDALVETQVGITLHGEINVGDLLIDDAEYSEPTRTAHRMQVRILPLPPS